VLETLAEIYRYDELAREQALSPEDRLRFHQTHSGPVMAALRAWLTGQLDEHHVEPNSGLGRAMRYLLNHWEPLTLFLRAPGAPLDKGYASYCTSCARHILFSGNRRRSESLVPCVFRGGLGPGSSYRNTFLSVAG